MSVYITYFVHWTTLDNENEISSWWWDIELSQLWTKQSLELKKLIDIKSFDVVFCSDLIRAKKSAELTFKWQVEIIQDPRLRECNYWIYNSKKSEIVEPLQEKNIYSRFEWWESYEDVKLRISEFLKMLKEKYDWKKVAIVAHKASQLALDVMLKWYTWQEAFDKDWRKTKNWNPWWEYELN